MNTWNWCGYFKMRFNMMILIYMMKKMTIHESDEHLLYL